MGDITFKLYLIFINNHLETEHFQDPLELSYGQGEMTNTFQ